MPLLTLAELRAVVESDRTDAELTALIAREEAMLVRKLGAHGDGVTAVTEVLEGHGGDLFLPRSVVSVTSVNGATGGYTALPRQGRIYGTWYGLVTVVYVPADDRDERRAALIDLVRLAVSRTAMKAESVAGEYSYQAPDWQAARAEIYRRLMFTSV